MTPEQIDNLIETARKQAKEIGYQEGFAHCMFEWRKTALKIENEPDCKRALEEIQNVESEYLFN